MAQKKAHPAVRFLVAFLIVIAVAFVAFFVGYLLGMRIAVVPPVASGSVLGVPFVRGDRPRRQERHDERQALRPVAAGSPGRSSSSPARPATWAAGWCRACWRPATACAAWCATRRVSQGRDWLPHVEVVTGDALRPGGLADALGRGRRRLLPRPQHGSAATASASATSRRRGASPPPPPRPACGASSTSAASATRRRTSPHHLRSRQDTGDALREAGVPVTEFRAAVVVGSGSISFEMMRYLTERLPVMICPQVGVHESAAHRRGRPSAVPRGRPGRARERRPGDRDRRRRRAHLRRHDARLRRGARPGSGCGCSPCRCSRPHCCRTGSTS